MFLAAPIGATSAVVGTVQESNGALVRGMNLVPGTTVYNDDKIEVGAHGGALIALQGGAQVQLRENSEVRILQASNSTNLQVVVARGMARFRSTPQAPVEAVLEDATVRPASGAGAGFINVTSASSAFIGAEKGALMITTEHDGSSVTVPEGSAVSVKLAEPDPEPDRQSQTTVRKSHKLKVLIGAFIIGGIVGAAIGANMAEGPTNKGPAVSPFKP
jgi:hypothetical protein